MSIIFCEVGNLDSQVATFENLRVNRSKKMKISSLYFGAYWIIISALFFYHIDNGNEKETILIFKKVPIFLFWKGNEFFFLTLYNSRIRNNKPNKWWKFSFFWWFHLFFGKNIMKAYITLMRNKKAYYSPIFIWKQKY